MSLSLVPMELLSSCLIFGSGFIPSPVSQPRCPRAQDPDPQNQRVGDGGVLISQLCNRFTTAVMATQRSRGNILPTSYSTGRRGDTSGDRIVDCSTCVIWRGFVFYGSTYVLLMSSSVYLSSYMFSLSEHMHTDLLRLQKALGFPIRE